MCMLMIGRYRVSIQNVIVFFICKVQDLDGEPISWFGMAFRIHDEK